MAGNHLGLPEEIFELILLRLDVKDVLTCSCVCVGWRNAVNSNKIWEKLCVRNIPEERIKKSYGERTLTASCENSALSELCSWWKRFIEEIELKNNWRTGRCVEQLVADTVVRLHDLETDYEILLEPSLSGSFFTVHNIVGTPIETELHYFAIEQPIPEFFKFTNNVLVIVQCTLLQVYTKDEDNNINPEFRALFDKSQSYSIPDTYNLTDWYCQTIGLYPCDIYVRCDHNGKYFVGYYDSSADVTPSLLHIWDIERQRKIKGLRLPHISPGTIVLAVNFSLRKNIIHFIIKLMEPSASFPCDAIYGYDIDRLSYNDTNLRIGFVIPTIFFTDTLAILSDRPAHKIFLYDLKSSGHLLDTIEISPSMINHRSVQVIGDYLLFSTFAMSIAAKDAIYVYDVKKLILLTTFSLPSKMNVFSLHIVMEDLMVVNGTRQLVVWDLKGKKMVSKLNYIDFIAPGPLCTKMISQNSEGKVVVLSFW